MTGAPKVLLETIQVARHVGRLGLRPVQKVVHQVAQSGEDCAVWAIKLQPVQSVLGRERSNALLDQYFQAKDVVGQSAVGIWHQVSGSALQSTAKYATMGMSHAGIKGRVVCPLDAHWHTLKVIKALRMAEQERMAHKGHGSVKLTPKRFVQFMRDAERKRRRARRLDPIEDYVDQMLQSGTMSSMGPRQLERKLYTDVARVICFAFDRALFEANGADVWGHSLNVRVVKEDRGDEAGAVAFRRRPRSAISVEQVEHLVDRMLKSKDLEVPVFMQSLQRQLLVNCSVMLLHLIEDLSSERHMQINLLGHSLGVSMDALPTHQLYDQEQPDEMRTFRVNSASVDELVEALIDEPEVQLIFLPDALEAEIYRLALHRMICIGQFMLSQLRVRLFGSEVRLEFSAGEANAEGEADAEAAGQSSSMSYVNVLSKDVKIYKDRLDAEKRSIERELHRRQLGGELPGGVGASLDDALASEDKVHSQFEDMALQDPNRLSRHISIQRVVGVPIEVAYELVSDVQDYPVWMPYCTASRLLPGERSGNTFQCEVGLGISTVVGVFGDNIRYKVMVTPPVPSDELPDEDGLRVASVFADTPGGFAFGKRLVYDWRFRETAKGETDVHLNVFFQARNVWFLPLWDSMEGMVTTTLMTKLMARAKERSAQSTRGAQMAHVPGSGSSTAAAVFSRKY